MSKRIQVLGIDIDNHTLREAMFLLEEYVNTEGLNLVGIITSDLLMQAADNQEIRQVIDGMDLHVIGDISILEVVEENFEQQAGEILKRDLEEIFLNSLIRKRKTAYWISDYENDLAVLETYMQEHYPKLDIAGHFCGRIEDNLDSLLNEINSIAPDVIFIQTGDWLRLGHFLQSRNQLNTKLCVCMGYRVKSKFWSSVQNSKIKSLIDQTMFKRRAIRYETNKNT